MNGKDSGEATVLFSIAGAIASGAPLAVGVAIKNQDFVSSAYLITAIVVSLATIGAGVGRLYARWKKQIELSVHRDDLLEDLCSRVKMIEDRQLMIIDHLDRINK